MTIKRARALLVAAPLLALVASGCSGEAEEPSTTETPQAEAEAEQNKALDVVSTTAAQYGLAMESALVEDGVYPTDVKQLRAYVALRGSKLVSLETAPTGEYGAYVLCVERDDYFAVYEGLEAKVTESGTGSCPAPAED